MEGRNPDHGGWDCVAIYTGLGRDFTSVEFSDWPSWSSALIGCFYAFHRIGLHRTLKKSIQFRKKGPLILGVKKHKMKYAWWSL